MMQALMQGDRNYLYPLLHSLYTSFYETQAGGADENDNY